MKKLLLLCALAAALVLSAGASAQVIPEPGVSTINLYVVYGPVCGRGGCMEYPQAKALVRFYIKKRPIGSGRTNKKGHIIFRVPAYTRVTAKVTARGRTVTLVLPALPTGAVLNWTARFCGNIC